MAEEKSAASKYSDVEELCVNLIQKMEEESRASVSIGGVETCKGRF